MPFRFVRLQRRWRHPRGVLSRMPPGPTTQAFPLPPIARESSGRRQAEAHSPPPQKKRTANYTRHIATRQWPFPTFFQTPIQTPKNAPGAFSRGSVPDRRRAGKRRQLPRRRGRASMQGAFSRGSVPDRRRAGKRRQLPRRRGRASMQGAFSRGSVPDRRRAGKRRQLPRRRGRASMQGAFSRGSVPDRRRAGKCRQLPIAGAYFHARGAGKAERPSPPRDRRPPRGAHPALPGAPARRARRSRPGPPHPASATTPATGQPRRSRPRPGPYSVMLVTTPAPTVRPPSRIANRSPSSIAIGLISCTDMFTLSPGITISTSEGSSTVPVTSVVRK